MEPKQPNSWPPAPNAPVHPNESAKLRLLTSNAKKDGYVGSLIAFVYLLMALVLRSFWQRTVSPLRFWLIRQLLHDHLAHAYFWIDANAPLIVAILLAPIFFFGLKRSVPLVGKAFGEYILIMIAIYTIGYVILPLITGHHHRF